MESRLLPAATGPFSLHQVRRCMNKAVKLGNCQAETLHPCTPREMPQVEKATLRLRNREGKVETCWDGRECCGFLHVGQVGSEMT